MFKINNNINIQKILYNMIFWISLLRAIDSSDHSELEDSEREETDSNYLNE